MGDNGKEVGVGTDCPTQLDMQVVQLLRQV